MKTLDTVVLIGFIGLLFTACRSRNPCPPASIETVVEYRDSFITLPPDTISKVFEIVKDGEIKLVPYPDTQILWRNPDVVLIDGESQNVKIWTEGNKMKIQGLRTVDTVRISVPHYKEKIVYVDNERAQRLENKLTRFQYATGILAIVCLTLMLILIFRR